ncbi:N-acetylmuramidase family protein [Flavobacteriaceae bacterium TK19130]|nr:N-acetylmuramidase family protein [Thermobacterium salinum]
MKTLKYRSRGNEVFMLEEILVNLGFDVYISNYFGTDTRAAVIAFQQQNSLVVDGIVGPKTWSKLIEKNASITQFNDKFLSEADLQEFADSFDLELAAVKAVNEIESNGKGFLLDGRPRILFEGHVFWQELKNRGVNPLNFKNEHSKNVLYKSWTKKYYEGGEQEYDRLEKAAGLSDDDRVHDAAYCSASWGAFQIMGFHYADLDYPNIDSFVSDMYTHEKSHLKAFGLFCKANGLLQYIRNKNWAKFAKGYNGSGYKENKYDSKLKAAYEKYLAL